ncbi:Clr5 domain-containing protein [Xylaria sp. FL1042]|nr:Clr5 domain-containing protein [Xylaria sp. FL1042]
MQTSSIRPPELRQSETASVHLNNKSSAPVECLYLGLEGLDIPVRVVTQRTEHARTHSQDEWEAMRPTIHKLYIEDLRSLDVVMRTMAEKYGFYATNKMYKIRFSRWGWRKNRSRGHKGREVPSDQAEKEVTAIQHQIQHLRAPDLIKDQEYPISIARKHTIDVSGLQRWCSSFDMTKPTPYPRQHISMARFFEAEVAFSETALQLGRGRINSAFLSLNRLFDTMTGNELYLHPKHPTAFWLLCDGIYNACTLVKDSTFHLLRELLNFLAQNAIASFRKSSSVSSHYRVSLIVSLVRMSRENPSAMKQTFRTAYRATAESLEVELGRNHPVVLITWLDYFWYFNFLVDPAADLVARYQSALKEVEVASGREADATITFSHHMILFIFYCVGDESLARKSVSDLLERINSRIEAQGSATLYSLHFQRAYALGSLLQGLFILEDYGDLSHCERVLGTTIERLKHCEGSSALMHARMLETDLLALTNAWKAGKGLRGVPLAFAKPRFEQNPRREVQPWIGGRHLERPVLAVDG